MKDKGLTMKTLAALPAALILALAAGPTLAESACQGLEQRVCESKADCTWVGGYTRQDGKQVSGYCRGKGSQGESSKEPEKKPAGAAKEPEKNPAAMDKEPEKKPATKETK